MGHGIATDYKPQVYVEPERTRFYIPINDLEGDTSQTFHVVTTESQSRRTNKRKLKAYLLEVWDIPESQHKRILKQLGFWGDKLGNKP